jgi:hypothetical protein
MEGSMGSRMGLSKRVFSATIDYRKSAALPVHSLMLEFCLFFRSFSHFEKNAT